MIYNFIIFNLFKFLIIIFKRYYFKLTKIILQIKNNLKTPKILKQRKKVYNLIYKKLIIIM